MTLLRRFTLNVTRYGVGSLVNARWVEGTPSVISIKASVQPVTPDQMQSVPENRRDSELFALYTSTLLKTVDPAAGTNADTVVINSITYEVMSVGSWQNNILPHYVAVVAKVVAE